MSTNATASDANAHKLYDEQTWAELYRWLLSLVELWVCNSGIVAWYGQHKEISEDVTQEAIARTFDYYQRACRGEVDPILFLKAFACKSAQNHLKDKQKKDWRLIRPSLNTNGQALYTNTFMSDDPADIAITHLANTERIIDAAYAVADFPAKQQKALLVDIANKADLDELPTLFEQILLAKGLHLRDYKYSLPIEIAERGRHAALLCTARKRLRCKVKS